MSGADAPLVSSARRGYAVALTRLVLVVGALALWEYAAGRWVETFWISSPSLIGSYLWEWAHEDLLTHIAITTRETLLGYLTGSLSGIAAGVLLSRLEFAREVLDPIIMAINGIPRIALAPLFIIWFGIGETSKVVLAAMLTFFLCFYATLSGLKSIDPQFIKVGRLLGGNGRQIFFKVVLPAAAPWIITALKVSLPFALIGAIVGEFMASTAGLGFMIRFHTSQFNATGAFAGVFVLMVFVVLINVLLDRIERHLLRWRASAPGSGTHEI
jgi:NitT/TauT family transport system permease protein